MSRNPSQTILITGCSSGFGLLIAARLASRGHKVIATMRDLNKSGALRDEVKRRGGELDLFPLDATKKLSVNTTVQEIAAKYGYIDVLINNAGYGVGGFFEDLADEEIREQFETNFFGVQNVCRAVIPLMRARRSGKIINISSVAGFSTSPGLGAYNASKWALEAFSESLRYELALWGIQVLLVQPGTYQTKMFGENARYAVHFDNPQSPYHPMSQHLKRKVMSYVDRCRKSPETVAILIEKLIYAKNSPFRSHPDIEARLLFLLRKFLPFRVYSGIIRAVLYSGLKK